MTFKSPKVKLILFKSKIMADGRHPILVRVTFRGQRKYFSTGVSAKIAEWDDESCQFYTKAMNDVKVRKGAIALNKQINGFYNDIESFCTSRGRDFDLKALELPKIRTEDFKLLMQAQIKAMNKKGEAGNALIYQTALNLLMEFKVYPESRISFNSMTMREREDWERLKAKTKLNVKQMNQAFMSRFKSWLDKRGVSENTKSVYFRTIRAAFNKAIADGDISESNYPFTRSMSDKNNFRVSEIKTTSSPRGVNRKQVEAFKAFDPQDDFWQKEAQSFFMLSFYFRGMNAADLIELKWAEIKNGRFTYIRKKTKTRRPTLFDVKVTPQAEPYLDYYRQFNRAYILPVLNGKEKNESERVQKRKTYLKKVNAALREIGEQLEFPLKLTSYVARHGFSKVSREGGAKIEAIKDALGHSSLDMTDTYLKALDTEQVDKTQENLP